MIRLFIITPNRQILNQFILFCQNRTLPNFPRISSFHQNTPYFCHHFLHSLGSHTPNPLHNWILSIHNRQTRVWNTETEIDQEQSGQQNSKRKVNVFGKKQKKRYAAEVVLYMSRAQTLQKADSLSRITGNARFEVNDVYLHLYS